MFEAGKKVAQKRGCLLGCVAIVDMVVKQDFEVKGKKRED